MVPVRSASARLSVSALLVHRLSRHAIRHKGDLRTSSTALLDKPISASRWSSSSRSCLHWYRRSHLSAIPDSHVSGIFQDHFRSGNECEDASRLLVELQIVLPQDMFHLRNGAKQRLAAGAHRAAVNGPSASCITPTFGAQAMSDDAPFSRHRAGVPWPTTAPPLRFRGQQGQPPVGR
jgi:hypothetical protein